MLLDVVIRKFISSVEVTVSNIDRTLGAVGHYAPDLLGSVEVIVVGNMAE